MAKDALVFDLARAQWGLVSRARALRAGMSLGTIDSRLRRGEWEPMGAGVYRLPGVAHTWHQRALAPCLQAEPFAVLSHRSAAFIWRLDALSRGPPEPIQVVVPRGRSLTASVEVRASRHFEHGVYKGMPVTPLSRTLVDLAATVAETELELALDSAMRFGPRAMKALHARLDRAATRGRPRIELLREMLKAYDGTLDSALEVLVRKLLFAASLPKPVTHYDVWHQRRWIANVDFAWPKQRMLVQAHGLKWHLNRYRYRIDQRQQSELAAAGWLQLTVTWDEATKHPARFIDTARAAWERVCMTGGLGEVGLR